MGKSVVYFFPFLIGLIAAAEELPVELRYLDNLKADEKVFVDAVREFDLKQVALMDEDLEIINGYSRTTQRDLIESKFLEAEHRQELIGKAWNYVLDHYPTNARANNYYGEYMFDQMGEEIEAIVLWKKSTHYDSKLPNPHNNLGIYYFHTGQYEQGYEHLERAVELDPDHPDYNFNMAQMYLNHFTQLMDILDRSKKKLFKDAMRYSKKATRLAPEDFEMKQDYAVNFYAGENFDVKVDWDDAARAWQDTVPLARNEDERFFAYLNEGRTWSRADRQKDAATAFRAALAIKPDSLQTSELLKQAEEAAN